MHASVFPISRTAARQLVEGFDGEAWMIEHDMTDIRNIDPFAKSRCCEDQTERTFFEGLLHGAASFLRQPAMVVADQRPELIGKDLAQTLRERKRLLAAVDKTVKLNELLFAVACIDNM